MKKFKLILSIAFSFLVSISVYSVSASTTDEVNEDGIIVEDGQLNGGVYNEPATRSSKVMDSTFYEKQSIAESFSYQPGISTRALGPGYRTLNVPHKTQENNYYCGPASVQMVLAYKGKNVSQSTLASRLGTTSANGTSAGANVPNALNYYLGNRYGWHWQAWSDVSGMRSKIYAGMAAGDPTVVNTHETRGDSYIKGHENFASLYHFGVVDAMTQQDTVRYNDPGAGRFSGMIARQMLETWRISYAAGGRGIAW